MQYEKKKSRNLSTCDLVLKISTRGSQKWKRFVIWTYGSKGEGRPFSRDLLVHLWVVCCFVNPCLVCLRRMVAEEEPKHVHMTHFTFRNIFVACPTATQNCVAIDIPNRLLLSRDFLARDGRWRPQ
jgi:hypothetical protein